MGDPAEQRTGTRALPNASLPESTTGRPGAGAATTPKMALRRALSSFQELLADPHVIWGGKTYDREECAALEKMLRQCEGCVGPATSGSRFHDALQSVTGFLENKAALSAELRSLSTLKCKKRDFPAVFTKKLKIQHQLYRQRCNVPSTTYVLDFAAAIVEAVTGVYRCAATELLSAREKCEHLRRELLSPKTDEEATRQEAKRLCLEGHAFRFGYGCSPQLSRAYNMYIAAARLGAVEGLTCAGILLEEGLVDVSACAEDSFLVSVRRADGSGSLPEPPSTADSDCQPASLHSESPISLSKLDNSERKQASYSMSCTRARGRAQRVGTPTPHDRLNKARIFFEQAAHLGHPDALFRLGRMTEKGQGGLSPDHCRALQYYRQAAEKGHAEAQVAVGHAYEQGSVYAEDNREALRWYRAAAGQGSPTGLNNLASLYYRGYGCPVDYEKAAMLFKKAAALGDIHACYNLAICYEFGRGVLAEDSDRALQLYLQAAQAGHVKASTALGTLLFRLNAAAGKPAEAYAEAARWLQIAASKEDSEAIFMLGQLYENGLGLVRDPGQALACYRKAATGEVSPKVHLRLAHLLFSGQAGTGLGSKTEAFKHYRTAAEEGNDPEAWNCLGLCHEEGLGSGDGFPQYADAAKCYERAVQHEYVDAMCNLARLLTKGVGVPQDAERGFELLKRAASEGHLQAKIALENQGRIVPRPILEVALGYADAVDKPPAPAIKPTSPILQKNRQRELLHASSSGSCQMSKEQGRTNEPYEQAGEDETNVATLSSDKKLRSRSLPFDQVSRCSSPETSITTPREGIEYQFSNESAKPVDSTTVAMSGKGKEHGIKTRSIVSTASSSSLKKNGSSGKVQLRNIDAHDRPVAPSGPLPTTTNQKLMTTSSSYRHNSSQDASSSSKDRHCMLSPLSPGQVACWMDYSPSFSHRVSAASPASKLVCGTRNPHGRKSLAHLLYVDHSAPATTASVSMQHEENKLAHVSRKGTDAPTLPTGNLSVSRNLSSSNASTRNASGYHRHPSSGVRTHRHLDKTPILQEASFVHFPS